MTSQVSVVLLFASLVAAESTCQNTAGTSVVGTLIKEECGNLAATDCCIRCGALGNCVAADLAAGCCRYYSASSGTKANSSAVSLKPTSPGPGPSPTPPAPPAPGPAPLPPAPPGPPAPPAPSPATNCFERQGQTKGTPVGTECGALKKFDCCARCSGRAADKTGKGCKAVDIVDGCCYYYSTFEGTVANASVTSLAIDWPMPPTPAPESGSYCKQAGWNMVFEDEFNGADLDPNNWNVMEGHDAGTLRQALGTRDSVSVKDGNLVLKTWLDGYDPLKPRPTNCTTLLPETDIEGGQSAGTASANDVGECCSLCHNNSVCGSFTYMPGAWGCTVGCCYMKSADSLKIKPNQPGVTSGFVPGAGIYKSGALVSGGLHGGSSVPVGHADQKWKYGRFCVSAKLPGVESPSTVRPTNCSALLPNTDVLGGDVGQASAKDEGECCDTCRGNSMCAWFVYMKGAWGCDVGCCYMKSSAATGFNTSAPGRVAGFVPGSNDKNQGIWPAHWLMPDTTECWPTKGEIDVMEMINGDGNYHGTYHWSGDGKCNADAANGGQAPAPTTWASEYHEYALEWTKEHMYFVVDGAVKKVVLPGYPATYGGPTRTTFYDEPYYWLLNTAVGAGGTWAGPPGPNTVLPAYHYIDYVRVAQKTTDGEAEIVV